MKKFIIFPIFFVLLLIVYPSSILFGVDIDFPQKNQIVYSSVAFNIQNHLVNHRIEKAVSKQLFQEIPGSLQNIESKETSTDPIHNKFSQGIKLIGGGSYSAIGDINADIKGYNSTIIGAAGVDPEGKDELLNFGYNINAEIVFRFLKRFGIGLGAGYIKLKNQSLLTFVQNSDNLALKHNPGVKAVPIFLGLYFYPFKNIYLNTGLTYCYADFSYGHRLEFSDFWIEESGEASSKGFGFFTGIGVEFPIFKHLCLVLEGKGSYLKLDGFNGKKVIDTSIGHSSEEEGLFYFSKLDDSDYGFLTIDIEESDGINVDQAKVDLSGFSLNIGFRISF